MGPPRTSGWSPLLVDTGVTQPHTNAKAATHDHGSTEEVSGRSKSCSLCAAHDAACGSSCKWPMKSSASLRSRHAGRRDLLQQAA